MNYFLLFLQKPKLYGSKGLSHETFENRIRFGWDIQLLNISAYAQGAMKSFPHMLSMDEHVKLLIFYRWLSMRKNLFGVDSVCNEIVSS